MHYILYIEGIPYTEADEKAFYSKYWYPNDNTNFIVDIHYFADNPEMRKYAIATSFPTRMITRIQLKRELLGFLEQWKNYTVRIIPYVYPWGKDLPISQILDDDLFMSSLTDHKIYMQG